MSVYSGVERLLVDFLTADVGVRVCTELPADLADVVPLVQVQRVGGPTHDADPYYSMPTVSVDSFDVTRLDALDLANTVDLSLRRHLAGATVPGAVVTRVSTISGPSWRPWDDTGLRRFGASYQLWIKAAAEV